MQPNTHLHIVNLGHMDYAQAYSVQKEHLAEVFASRTSKSPQLGHLLFVEHPATITVTRRPTAQGHITASPEQLKSQGVQIHQTDRGGDVTYHGPGQLVCYPIIDLNAANLRLHNYMRLLETAVIDTMTHFNIQTQRDQCATGVWTAPPTNTTSPPTQPAKICALGLRVQRWISMHGLAINITTNLEHFNLIVPCGLAGRPVTSMLNELGQHQCPSLTQVQSVLADQLTRLLTQSAQKKNEEHDALRS